MIEKIKKVDTWRYCRKCKKRIEKREWYGQEYAYWQQYQSKHAYCVKCSIKILKQDLKFYTKLLDKFLKVV